MPPWSKAPEQKTPWSKAPDHRGQFVIFLGLATEEKPYTIFLYVSSPWKRPVCSLSLWTHLFWTPHIHGFVQNVAFGVQLLTRRITLSKIHPHPEDISPPDKPGWRARASPIDHRAGAGRTCGTRQVFVSPERPPMSARGTTLCLLTWFHPGSALGDTTWALGTSFRPCFSPNERLSMA